MPADRNSITCKPVKILTDVRLCAEAPRDCYDPWGRFENEQERLKAVEHNLRRWIKYFEDFLRDHRSLDEIYLSVEREYTTMCSSCGWEWEGTEKDEVGEYCVCCGAYTKINADAWQQTA